MSVNTIRLRPRTVTPTYLSFAVGMGLTELQHDTYLSSWKSKGHTVLNIGNGVEVIDLKDMRELGMDEVVKVANSPKLKSAIKEAYKFLDSNFP